MTSFATADLMTALPEVYLAGAICLVLLFDLFVAGDRPERTGTFTLVVLLVGAALTLYTTEPGTRVQVALTVTLTKLVDIFTPRLGLACAGSEATV